VNRFVKTVLSAFSPPRSALAGGFISIYLKLIATTRTWFGVRERSVPDPTLSSGENLPTRIQMLLIDRLSRASRTHIDQRPGHVSISDVINLNHTCTVQINNRRPWRDLNICPNIFYYFSELSIDATSIQLCHFQAPPISVEDVKF
jgi:hypothetical protein